jgi:hypothetical protein
MFNRWSIAARAAAALSGSTPDVARNAEYRDNQSGRSSSLSGMLKWATTKGALKWNQGVNNEMVYITGNIPSGTYDPNRLANLNLGFVAWDLGAGYTYFDPKTGHEFSVAGGFTYSLPNPYLQYQNGIDFHIDWAASQFVSKNVQIGLAGYFYQQVTDDSGPGAKFGGFRGQAIGIGPQIGFIFPLSDGYQGYLNVRGYKDVEVENRAKTWSTWVTFAISPSAPEPTSAKVVSRKY